jgi:hypothetical protein
MKSVGLLSSAMTRRRRVRVINSLCTIFWKINFIKGIKVERISYNSIFRILVKYFLGIFKLIIV